MLAKIIPLIRLPLHLAHFDYLVPSDLTSIIKPGQMVQIPFKKSQILGIVFAICENEINTSTDELKTLIKILNYIPLISKKQIDLAEKFSQIYGISFGKTIKLFLPPLQKRKLSKMKLEKIENEKNASEIKNYKINFIINKNETELRQILKSEIKKYTLIIVPEIKNLSEIINLLGEEQKKQTLIWSSALSEKEQFTAWEQIRNGKKNIIIGTRGAIFLPFQKLKKIIIYREHDESLKNWDQAPCFHSLDGCKLLSQTYNNKITLISNSPTVESYYQISKKNYLLNNKTYTKKLLFEKNINDDLPIIVDSSENRQKNNFSILSLPIQLAIENQSDNKDIFLFINRKGSTTTIRCLNCGHTETCPETGLPLIYSEKTNLLTSAYTNFFKLLPTACPKCNSILTKMNGIGLETLERELRQNEKISEKFKIITIDKQDDKNNEKTQKQMENKIIIGTEAAFSFVDWTKIGIIAFLDIDRQISIPELYATEKIWHLIQDVLYYKNKTGNFYLQTSHPDHYIFRSLSEPDRFYRLELNYRQKTLYPPYKYIIKYIIKNPIENQAVKQALLVKQILSDILTKESKNVIISHPFATNPKYFRKGYSQAILVKIDPKNWNEDTIFVNRIILANGKKIDPHPISLLSPY